MRATVLCIAAAAVLFCAGCGGSGDSPTAAAPPIGASPSGALTDGYAVLRRPQRPDDALPGDLVPRAVVRSLHLDLATSRRARAYHGVPVYVVLSDELACTYSTYNPVGNCWPIPTVRAGIAFASSICGLGTRKGEIVVYGLVPDGVRRVKLLRPDGQDSSASVKGNFFVVPSSAEPPLPRQLSLSMSDGRQLTRPTGIPADVAQRGCADDRPVPPPRGSQ
jgi:hypothetical protein